MRREIHIVSEDAIRPAGKPDECFYCQAKINTEHNLGCVMREQTVVVRFSFDLVMTTPENWSPSQIENYYGKGTWCGDNIYQYLEHISGRNGCLCSIMNASFVREATAQDELDQVLVKDM